MARSLDVKNGDKTKVDKLFETTDDSIATTELILAMKSASHQERSAKARSRLAAAGTYTTGKENGNGRFVVVGSSGFASNGFIGFQRKSRPVPEHAELAELG